MWQDAYKLVDVYKGRRRSFNYPQIWDIEGLTKFYVKGKKIVPSVGFLYAFNNVEDATTFMNSFTPNHGHIFELWRCRVIIKEAENHYIWHIGNTLDLIDGWKDVLKGLFRNSTKQAPKGTVYCSAIILKEKLAEKHGR